MPINETARQTQRVEPAARALQPVPMPTFSTCAPVALLSRIIGFTAEVLHQPMPVVHRLPAYLLNGIAVALGISIIQFLVVATAGPQAGALAMSGAVCASLADVPNTVHRTAQRVRPPRCWAG